jgi:SAM-dependent methyltransferase
MRGTAVDVQGTTGYAEVVDQFTQLSESIDFRTIHRCLLPLLPSPGARVLDIGAGTGRDAAALAELGYQVTAIEPTPAFLATARTQHPLPDIDWISGSLPELAALPTATRAFDFILCHAVWQHLDPEERAVAMARVATLLNPGGIFALGLRHGPAGAGTHYFEADIEGTVALAAREQLPLELKLERQPSALANKTHVSWTRLAFRRE